MSHAKHVPSLMHHHMTGILDHGNLRVSHGLIMIAFWVISQEAEHTCPRCIHGPSEDKDPVLARIEILHHDCQHAVGILRDSLKSLS